MNDDAPYVLIADDDPLVLRSITFVLQRAGFPVRAVTDGAAALEMIRTQPPAVALLDVMMPEMNGLEVCRTVKDDPATRHIPVFLVTARAMAAERERGLRAGADQYITKPFVNRTLIELVTGAYEASRAH
jgi:CheY-like chemotaxis protein